MPLAIYDTGGIGQRSFIKYNAKTGKWSIGNEELRMPVTFIADLANIRTGWLKFAEGGPPKRCIDRDLEHPCPQPTNDYKRGFVMTILLDGHGPLLEFSSASFNTNQAVVALYDKWEKAGNRNKLPAVSCNGVTASKGKFGTNYAPNFEITGMVTRPANLPDISPVDDDEVYDPQKPLAGFDDKIPF